MTRFIRYFASLMDFNNKPLYVHHDVLVFAQFAIAKILIYELTFRYLINGWDEMIGKPP